ncbi:MAG: archease [Sulfuritalea sp.]|nr:archease [Sulfuritalea sp.]
MNTKLRMETQWETFAHEADVGVRGSGATLAEAFAGAATAMTAAICDPARVGARDAVIVTCEAPDAEMLLVDWLNALVYEMATRRMLFARFEVTIEDHRPAAGPLQGVAAGSRRAPRAEVTPAGGQGPGGGNVHLRAIVWGEPVDVARHQPAAEVKGASFCELTVRRDADGRWLAQCIVDV